MVLSTVPASSRLTENPTESHHLSSTVYGSATAQTGIPRFELGEDELDARVAARFVHDELLLDGRPALNLASFVTTYMEEEVEQLMLQNLPKNFIDVEEYPSCGEIETRCVNIVARLFNAPLDNADSEAVGVSTIGSSEAIILAVLAAKRRWQHKRRAEGKSTEHPNIVMNAAVQVCWEKAARYLEVEERFWYCSPGKYVMDPEECAQLVDENTILVCAILGTTYTGQYEDVKGINNALEKRNKEIGTDVYIHVDAASGGFVAPFLQPDIEWDFRLPRVASINASGHKYGLAYAGVGWAVWRSRDFLPEDILFTVSYLGSPQVSFTLNFSKSAIQVIGQYYQFLRLGKIGYTRIMENLGVIADKLANEIELLTDSSGKKLFTIISDGSKKALPLVAWSLIGEHKYDEFAIAAHLRQRGWIVPAYTMAPHTEFKKLLRVVVREDFSRSRSQTFLRDLKDTIKFLDNAPDSLAAHFSRPDHKKEAEKAAKNIKAGEEVKEQEQKERGADGNGYLHEFFNGKKEHDKHIHAHVDEKHSLQGKHGKSHIIC